MTAAHYWPSPIVDEGWRNRTRISSQRLRNGWGDFLCEFQWQWAAALTFRRATEGATVRSISMEAFHWLNELSRLSRVPLGWAYAVEGGGGRRLHLHALLAGLPDRSVNVAVATWEHRNGSVRIAPVYDRLGAVNYLCKEIGAREVVLADTLSKYRYRIT